VKHCREAGTHYFPDRSAISIGAVTFRQRRRRACRAIGARAVALLILARRPMGALQAVHPAELVLGKGVPRFLACRAPRLGFR
jgi:hypothetical protein